MRCWEARHCPILLSPKYLSHHALLAQLNWIKYSDMSKKQIIFILYLSFSLSRYFNFSSSFEGRFFLWIFSNIFLYDVRRCVLLQGKMVGHIGLKRKGYMSRTESSPSDCFHAMEAAWNCANVEITRFRWWRSSPAWAIGRIIREGFKNISSVT